MAHIAAAQSSHTLHLIFPQTGQFNPGHSGADPEVCEGGEEGGGGGGRFCGSNSKIYQQALIVNTFVYKNNN